MEERGNALRQSERAEFRRLNVLLDARKIKGGGIGTYTVNLIRGLASNDGVRLSILANPENLYGVNLPPNVKVIAEKAKCYSLEEYFLMSSRLPFQDYDVFHVPHYTLPFGIPIPTIVTIHDLIHIYKPERFFYPFFAKPLIRSALKRATRVITVSNASFQEIKHFAKQNPQILEKMRIVPNSIDLDILRPDVENGPSAVSTRKGDYFLAVFSNSKPHKGIKDLITAYQELRFDPEGRGERLLNKRLVLVGPGTENIKGHDFGSEAGSSSELIVLGEVSREALRRLYLNAAAVIIPSIAEGFCLQALEAHSLG
ncbi:MAG: glycosyltransferase family 4 protein, partial [SAR324 cluster bacterium]|nr:glycosyltransferase family 4 protein [SAR324 cluster bacterium]